MQSIIDLQQIPVDSIVRKTISIGVKRQNSIQQFSSNDTVKEYNLIGLLISRASESKRSINGNALINDAVLDSAYLDIKNGQFVIGDKIPLSEIVNASEINPQWGLVIAASDFRMENSGVIITNIAAIVPDEELQITFILIPQNL